MLDDAGPRGLVGGPQLVHSVVIGVRDVRAAQRVERMNHHPRFGTAPSQKPYLPLVKLPPFRLLPAEAAGKRPATAVLPAKVQGVAAG